MRDGALTVVKVAARVGYINASHFAIKILVSLARLVVSMVEANHDPDY
jgi:hypothetical protein